MIRSLVYMKYAAKALAKVFGKSLANAQGWPEYAIEVPIELAWDWGEQLLADFKEKLTSAQVREAQAEVVKAGPDYSEDELIEAVNAGFLDAPEPVRMTALALLGQIQSQSRQSLKRRDDPTGTTLPATLRLDSVESLAALLPNALPRYKVGDRPIQGFELAERLGVGGFGEVWKAHNPKRPGLAVALKFFTDIKARDWLASHEADILERVQTEVRHPGIVRLHNVYEDLACLQFEYVKGWTLARHILDWHALGKPDVPFIAGEFRKIVEILVDVHQIQPKPIVHRDLKPANVLVEVTSGGAVRYRITDFGIGGFAATETARKTRLGVTYSGMRNPSLLRGAHSPLYASPEQTRGENPDPRDDVFALGVLWYQMQTGRLDSGPPTGFDWSDELQVDRKMSEGMIRLMASCFSSKAEKRPPSAGVLVERLDALLAARPAVKPVPAEPRIEVIPPQPKVENVPDILTTKTASIPLKLIPAGTFMMGSPDGQGRDDEHPQHEVTISTPFYMGIHPVTQAQYAKLMGKNPSWFAATGGGKDQVVRMDTSWLPVEQVAWFEAAQFCNALSKAEGLEPAYRINGESVVLAGAKGFRLPTEAEWEYACRAGRTSDYGFDGDVRELPDYAWFDKNSDQRTHPVGWARANDFGLYDMHGNVWEWTGDGYEADTYLRSAAVDPAGPSQAVARVMRGGSWHFTAEYCRSADRYGGTPEYRDDCLGFRVALVRQETGRSLPYRKSEAKPAEPGIEVVPPRPKVEKALDRHVGLGDTRAIEVVPPPPMVEKTPKSFTIKTASISLKLIPAGTFMMGSPDGIGNDDERPQHEVTISKPFYLGIHPVTQAQYAKLMGKNPSWFAATGGGRDKVVGMDTSWLPVEQVAWFEAAQFCNALSKAEGLEPAYRINGESVVLAGNKGFRLPTEAEWEYACRAGWMSDYGFDGGERELPGHSWFDKNSDQRTHRVGEAKSNGFGLHDMHGNVWEWTGDGYEADYYLRSADIDPQAVARVIRGGSWHCTPGSCRSAARSRSTPERRYHDLGFRVALVRQETGRSLTYRKSEAKPAEPWIEVVPPRPEVKRAADPALRTVTKSQKVGKSSFMIGFYLLFLPPWGLFLLWRYPRLRHRRAWWWFAGLWNFYCLCSLVFVYMHGTAYVPPEGKPVMMPQAQRKGAVSPPAPIDAIRP